jgi:hypothetical protein
MFDKTEVLKQGDPKKCLLIAASVTALGLRIGNVKVRVNKLLVQSSDPGSGS